MNKWIAIVLLAIAAWSLAGLADVVVLKTGTTISGALVDLDAHTLYLRTASAERLAVAISDVQSIEIDPGKPRVPQHHWTAAVTRARHELASCRLAKQGTILGGLFFVVSGYILSEVFGYQAFGGAISGLGAVVALLGIATPTPHCGAPLHEVEILARIGLAYGWVY